MVCFRVSPCGICGGQIGNATGFLSEFFSFPCQYNSTGPPYSYIIWGMNNRPVGGRSSETKSRHIDINNNNIMDYACAIWRSAARSHIQKLQVLQSKYPHIATDIPTGKFKRTCGVHFSQTTSEK
jgi:hypothetical protein